MIQQMVTWLRNEMTEEPVLVLDCGAGQVPCPDCGGTGDYQLPDGEYEQCVPCKGTAALYVSV